MDRDPAPMIGTTVTATVAGRSCTGTLRRGLEVPLPGVYEIIDDDGEVLIGGLSAFFDDIRPA